jgi:methyl-accepting chemotaxis protein
MIALCWLSSAIAGAVAALACALAGGMWLVLGGPLWLGCLLAALICGAMAITLWSLLRLSAFLRRIAAVSTAVCAGDFDQRVIFPRARGAMKTVMDAFNGVVDINDAFVREAELAMAAGAEGRYYRKIRPEGMKGAFLKSVTGINRAIDLMAERQQMIGTAIGEVRRLAAAATEGDLDQRIDTNAFSGEYLELTESMNTLLETVAAPIEEAGAMLGGLARTDLRVRMQGSYGGAFARLQNDANTLADNMADIMGQLRGAARSLKTATSEILSGSNDLAVRTSKQAATIEAASAAMEQLAATVVDNAARADAASERAHAVFRTAEAIGSEMQQASTAMTRISASSIKISSITGLIDDIAFQTNLLALNASVEAARAGDSGAGFAVVAIEVRRLAQSAAQASSDIKALIEQSTVAVDGGTRLVADVADKLVVMLEGVRENSTFLEAIARASKEQSNAISEVSIAVRQMDEMTQHNAALVEETNASIEQTENEAQRLDSIVDTFVVDTPHGEVESRLERSSPVASAQARGRGQAVYAA